MRVFAHRGASGYAPENTLAAFDLAIEMGADGIETDIRTTADGQLVLLHDEKVDRTTDGQGRVANIRLAELRQLDAGRWFDPRFSGQRILTLGEFLERYGQQTMLCLEIKAPGVEEETIALVRAQGLLTSVLFTSFQPGSVTRLRSLAPEAHIGFLTPEFGPEIIDRTTSLGANQINPPAALLTADLVQAARSAGLGVGAWAVKDVQVLETAVSLGIDGLTIDHPDRALQMLRRRSGRRTG